MTLRLNIENSWPVKAAILIFGLGFLGILALGMNGYGFNLTPSHPRGLYRLLQESPGKGDYVVFCLAPDHPYRNLAAQRGYLGPGGCPSGLRPLLKQLSGLPGDQVGLVAEGLILNGFLLPGTQRPAFDREGRELPPTLLSEGLIPAGLALVLSPDQPGAFDGRHFGLVPLAGLVKSEPVITLDF